MGDDHMAESSSTAHQSEFVFADMMMPILSPAGVQEIVDYGLMGIAMSRYTGTWTGIKCVKDTVESTASINVRRIDPLLGRPAAMISSMPKGGLNIRPRDTVLEQDERLTQPQVRGGPRLPACQPPQPRLSCPAAPKARLGIVTTGKAYVDVRQALDALGIDEVKANAFGLRVSQARLSRGRSSRKVCAPSPTGPRDHHGRRGEAAR